MSADSLTKREVQRITGYTDYQLNQLEKAGTLKIGDYQRKKGSPKTYDADSVYNHIQSELGDLKQLRASSSTAGEADADQTLKIARANKAIMELLETASTRIPLDVALNEQAEAMIALRAELTGLPRVLSMVMPKAKRRETIAAVRRELAIWLEDAATKIQRKLAEAKAVREEHFRILRSVEEAKLISKIERQIAYEEKADGE